MTDTHVYDLAEVDAIVADIVASKSEGFKYTDEYPRRLSPELQGEDTVSVNDLTCVYFYNGTPACIVGQVLARIGFGPGDVREFEGMSLQPPQILSAFSVSAVRYLTQLQIEQDAGTSWKEALDVTRDKHLPGHK